MADDDERAEALRKELLAAARERLQAHLAAEAAALAGDDADRAVVTEVQAFVGRLRGAG